ncbi:MAG TPA: 2-amino-4-hydroxy-6-hydroxymethyldihydropteridine diphosphokinase [Vicinamibacterales bacterium]|nr:2-amino-4-hydroxy-6-hydroxymethyldihydropteridine diphosphokinase [Vicinamibacterales bacterium]
MGRIAAVALGSNLGDRRANLDYAAGRLRDLLGHVRLSSYIDTDPVGVDEPQPRYLNAAAVGETSATARELLDALLAIERERGRERPHANAPRTLDLDLILLGDVVIAEPGLVVPHPRFRERQFVLAPLAEIGPELRDPVSGRTVEELLRRVRP